MRAQRCGSQVSRRVAAWVQAWLENVGVAVEAVEAVRSVGERVSYRIHNF